MPLTDRDPRNRQHLAAAYRFIQQSARVALTQRSREEVKALAGEVGAEKLFSAFNAEFITLPEDIPITGAFYLIEENLISSDNVIVRCTDCGASLQIRPESMVQKIKLCIFCTVDRMEATQKSP